MSKKVRIPPPLRKLTNNEELVEINAATIGEALVELQTRFPGTMSFHSPVFCARKKL